MIVATAKTENNCKKVLTKGKMSDIINEFHRKRRTNTSNDVEKVFEKNSKKVLTNEFECDIISALPSKEGM